MIAESTSRSRTVDVASDGRGADRGPDLNEKGPACSGQRMRGGARTPVGRLRIGRPGADDLKLDAALDEIELRVAAELAKRQQG
jgi:hypothetical protein